MSLSPLSKPLNKYNNKKYIIKKRILNKMNEINKTSLLIRLIIKNTVKNEMIPESIDLK